MEEYTGNWLGVFQDLKWSGGPEWPLALLHVLTQSYQWEAIQAASNQTVPISFRWIWNQQSRNPTTAIPIMRSRSWHGVESWRDTQDHFVTHSVSVEQWYPLSKEPNPNMDFAPTKGLPDLLWMPHGSSKMAQKLNKAWWPAVEESKESSRPQCTSTSYKPRWFNSYKDFWFYLLLSLQAPLRFCSLSSDLTNLLDFTPPPATTHPPPRAQTGKSKQSLISSKHFPLLR